MGTPNDASEDRLDQLQDGIDETRRQAEEHGTLPPTEPEPTFIDPDADGDADDSPGVIGGL